MQILGAQLCRGGADWRASAEHVAGEKVKKKKAQRSASTRHNIGVIYANKSL